MCEGVRQHGPVATKQQGEADSEGGRVAGRVAAWVAGRVAARVRPLTNHCRVRKICCGGCRRRVLVRTRWSPRRIARAPFHGQNRPHSDGIRAVMDVGMPSLASESQGWVLLEDESVPLEAETRQAILG